MCALKNLYEISKGKMGSLIKIYQWTARTAMSEIATSLTLNHLKKTRMLLENNQQTDDDEPINIIIPEEWENGCE